MAGKSAGSIFVDLLLRDARFIEGTRRSKREFQTFESGVTRATSAIKTSLISLVAGFSAFESLKGLTRLSDQYTNIQNRLKLVTSGTAELAQVQSQLTRISDNTYTSLSDNANLYNRLYSSTRELGASQKDVLAATEALQQTFRISGSTAAEAANSAVQFAQGLAAGALRGDEFRSVSEQNIRLMDLLAKGLGVTRGQLKAMADAGELTGAKIFPILVKALQELNAEAAGIAPTFDAAFSKLSEKFGKGIDDVIRANTEFNNLGESIKGLEPIVEAFGGKVVGGAIVALDRLIEKISDANKEFKDFLWQRGLITPENSSPVPSDYGLPPQYTEYTAEDFRIAMGRPPNPKSKPKIPDDWFLKKNEESQKASEKSQNSLTALYEKNRHLIQGLEKDTAKYMDTEKELDTLFRAKKITMEQYYTALDSLDAEYDNLSEKTKAFGFDLDEFSKEASRNLQDAFKDFFTSTEDGFDGLRKGFADMLAEMVANAAASNLANLIFGSKNSKTGETSGGLLSGLFESVDIGSWFSGFFAEGGFVEPGKWGVTGEQGPEMIYGGATGATVVPQAAMGKGGNTYYIDAKGADSGALRRIEASLLALAGPGVIESRVMNAQTRGSL